MCWNCTKLDHRPTSAEDREVFEQLRAGTLTRNGDRRLRERLWMYAWVVIRSHLRDGDLASSIKVGHAHRPISWSENEVLTRNDELRQEIAAEAIGATLPEFLRKLSTGRSWSPDREDGCALSTYWLRAVTSQVYKQIGVWGNDDYHRQWRDLREQPLEYADPAVHEDPTERIAQRNQLRWLLPSVKQQHKDPRSRQQRIIAAQYLAGHTRSQIAEHMKIKPRRVDYLMSDLRGRGWWALAGDQYMNLDVFPDLQWRVNTLAASGASSAEAARELGCPEAVATVLLRRVTDPSYNFERLADEEYADEVYELDELDGSDTLLTLDQGRTPLELGPGHTILEIDTQDGTG